MKQIKNYLKSHSYRNWKTRRELYYHVHDSRVKNERYMFALLTNDSIIYPYSDFDGDIIAALAEVYYEDGETALKLVIDDIVCYNQPKFDKERYFTKVLEVIKKEYCK